MTDVRDEITRILDRQDAKGVKKYGGTLDVTAPDAGELIQHAIEECADMLQYLVALRMRMSTDGPKSTEETGMTENTPAQ